MIEFDSVFTSGRDTDLGDLTPVISALLRRPLLTEEAEPELFRLARLREDDLRQWFQSTLGWRVRVSTFGRYVRLFKRRAHPPVDRSPLPSDDGRMSMLSLVLLCLVAEQLWRRSEITYGDLQREVIRTCAAESSKGRLPAFNPVTEAGEPRSRAEQHRRAFVEALLALQEWGIITCDGSLTAAGAQLRSDLVITCNPERLNDLLAAPAISQLQIDLARPDTHVPKLCEDQSDLPSHASETQRNLQHRHRALRAVVDDAVVDLAGERDEARYLTTSDGRRQALNAALVAGLTCVVRRDLWLTADPDARSTDLDFPQTRAIPGQAALLIVQWLNTSQAPATVTWNDCHRVVAEAKADNPEWAKSYRSAGTLAALASDAIAALTAAGVLVGTKHDPPTWKVNALHAYWRVRVSADPRPDPAPTPDSLFDQDGTDDCPS